MAMFSLNVNTTLEINASPHQIWRVLTDFAAYDEWNPMLRNVRTCLAPNAKVHFEVVRVDAPVLRLAAKITEHEPERSLVWRGGSRAMISGEHYFRIERLDNHRSRFHHGEQFSGLLLPLMRPLLNSASPLYGAMSNALKNIVERQISPELDAEITPGELSAQSKNRRKGKTQ